MRTLGYQRSPTHPVFFILLLLWCCVASQNTPTIEQKVEETESQAQDGMILTRDGDTFTTGEPFLWTGKSIATADLPPPKSLPTYTTTISARKQSGDT